MDFCEDDDDLEGNLLDIGDENLFVHSSQYRFVYTWQYPFQLNTFEIKNIYISYIFLATIPRVVESSANETGATEANGGT